MRAAVAARYGPPEVVRVVDVDRPEPAADELLVRVVATTVNRTDCGYRAAAPVVIRAIAGLRRPRRPVLGTEFAGVVEAVGPSVTTFAVGERVFGYVEGSFGAHAEYVTVAQDASVAAAPAGVPLDRAAAATEGAHYAMAFLRLARTGPGQDVLVHGATGAIGSAAVQLAVHAGATVTATCATGHVALVEGLGAARVIDRTTVDFTRDEQTYDVVMDAVGKSTFGRCRRLLRPGGLYVSSDLGPWGQNLLLALVTPWLPGRTVRFPFPRDDGEMVRGFAGLLASGALSPVIDRCYPLDQIVDAYRYVESGQKVGNVVITVGEE